MRLLIVFLSSFVAWAVPAAAQELVVNGGFESGAFTPFAPGARYDLITAAGPQDLTGWTVGNSLVWGQSPTDINPHAGAGFVDFTGIGNTVPHGSLSQTLTTTGGLLYDFSVFTTLDVANPLAAITVTVGGVPLTLSGANGVWDYSPTGAIWRRVTGSFTAGGAASVLNIAGQPGQSFMIGVDDVSVRAAAVSGAVPEPGSWAMMLIGFAVVGVGLRRRRVIESAPNCAPL